MKTQKWPPPLTWLALSSLFLLSCDCKRHDVENYFWMNVNDKITMNIDTLLGKEDTINSLSVQLETSKNLAQSSMSVQMPRDLIKIILKPEKKLEELEIKEILFHNDEGGYLAYSFL